MYPATVKCSMCRGELYVERLVCARYGTINTKGHG